MPYSTLHIRIDKQLEQRARRIAKRFGLTLPDLVRLFLSQFVRNPHVEIGGGIGGETEGK